MITTTTIDEYIDRYEGTLIATLLRQAKDQQDLVECSRIITEVADEEQYHGE